MNSRAATLRRHGSKLSRQGKSTPQPDQSMKSIQSIFIAIGFALLPGANYACAQGTAFTYQGRLTQSGNPANALYEMQFTLFDAMTNGNPVGAPISVAPVPVTNGLFTITLDFGASAFNGAAR